MGHLVEMVGGSGLQPRWGLHLCALPVRAQTKVCHYRISMAADGSLYLQKDRLFPSLDELLAYYKANWKLIQSPLLQPCTAQVGPSLPLLCMPQVGPSPPALPAPAVPVPPCPAHPRWAHPHLFRQAAPCQARDITQHVSSWLSLTLAEAPCDSSALWL